MNDPLAFVLTLIGGFCVGAIVTLLWIAGPAIQHANAVLRSWRNADANNVKLVRWMRETNARDPVEFNAWCAERLEEIEHG